MPGGIEETLLKTGQPKFRDGKVFLVGNEGGRQS